jgi:hypothetical protein
MISSGLCFLLGIQCPFRGPDYHSLWATQRGADQHRHSTSVLHPDQEAQTQGYTLRLQGGAAAPLTLYRLEGLDLR